MRATSILKIVTATLLPFLAFAQSDESVSKTVATLSAVVVTGEQPGPKLWKVTRGNHTLWILGMYYPLPAKMTWASARVETLLAQSQEVIDAGTVRFDMKSGFFKSVKAIPAAMRALKNQDGADLSSVLDAESYAKWLSLREKYIGRSKRLDAFRPTYAAHELVKEATKDFGLSTDSQVIASVIKKAVKKYHLKQTGTSPTINLTVDDPTQYFNNIAKLELDDLLCFKNTLSGLEDKLLALKASANAWALGDIRALTTLNKSRPTDECSEVLTAAMMSASDQSSAASTQRIMEGAKKSFDNAHVLASRLWLEAAERALANNNTTFSALMIYELVSPEGRLSALRAKGYTITEPQSVSD